MKRQIKQTQKSILLSTSMLSLATGMITQGANYSVQVFLGRILDPSDYGCYNALMAVLLLLGLPISSLSFFITRTATKYHLSNEMDFLASFYKRNFKKLVFFGLFVIISLLFLLPFVSNFLHIKSWLTIALLGPASMMVLFQPFNFAFSQGLQDYRWIYINNAMVGPIRFVFTVTAAWWGGGINGILLATFLGGIVGWLLSSIPLKQLWSTTPHQSIKLESLASKEIVFSFIATSSFLLMTQVDFIIVKHLFSAEQAGLYASVSVLAKAVLYVSSSVVIGLIPMVTIQHYGSSQGTWHLFKKALLITGYLSGSTALLFWFLSDWILQTFFGASYLLAAPLLKYFGLSMLPMSFILVMNAYFIARGANEFSLVILLGSLTMVLVIFFCANTLMAVVFYMGLFGFIVAMIGFLLEYHRDVPSLEIHAYR